MQRLGDCPTGTDPQMPVAALLQSKPRTTRLPWEGLQASATLEEDDFGRHMRTSPFVWTSSQGERLLTVQDSQHPFAFKYLR